MIERAPGAFDEPIWFDVAGHKDTRSEIEENVNGLAGKTFLQAFKAVLLEMGWQESTERYDSEVFAEDWGWCVFLQHETSLIMLGVHVLWDDLFEEEAFDAYLASEWVDCGLSVHHFHHRTLMDRLRGRNNIDPAVQEKAYRAVLAALADMDDVRGLSDVHLVDR